MKKLDPFQYLHVKHETFTTILIEFRGKTFEVYKKPTKEISGLTSSYKGYHYLINEDIKRSSKNNIVNWILKNA